MNLTRRGLLGTAALAGVLAGCAQESKGSTRDRAAGSPERVFYGPERDYQFADLRRASPRATPSATASGTSGAAGTTIVVLHGGYWLPQYGLDLMDPLADRLTALGYTTWNVEYRRTGDWRGTVSDVALAIDHLDEELSRRIVLLGHSAGGHLAAWAASRNAETPGGEPATQPLGVVSLGGVLDLTVAAGDPRSSAPVTAFMGGLPRQVPQSYAVADPARLVPAHCPVWAVHADHDQTVPEVLGSSYVAAARAAGGTAEEVSVPGDHSSLIDPAADSFPTIEKLLARAAS